MRSGLGAAAGAFVRGVVSGGEQDEASADINGTLRTLSERFRTMTHIATVKDHCIDRPNKGMIHWRWSHFRNDLDVSDLPEVEEVNRRLLSVMSEACDMPDAGLSELLLEGMVEGRIERHIADLVCIQREMYESRLKRGGSADQRMNTMDVLTGRVPYALCPDQWLPAYVSPLARLGAGFVLSRLKNVALLPAEDPFLHSMADWAEKREDKEYQRWVIEQRNAHFVRCICRCRGPIIHLLAGFGHDLTQTVLASNQENDAQVSPLVVTVRGIPRS